ncbi:tetratricopeptide repeat protein [Salinimonas lutimaris]|uniref:tetratricopeptide repeat protein n=1 Tax=Salinimonas lutimaris TaxID=914153 RepID=UPI0010C02A6B|nr:tetratricopeptide repeat protein [Salinimonas lutimaris]
MSVVNKMLRDLDGQARHQETGTHEKASQLPDNQYQPPGRSHHISLILIAMLVLLATGAAGYFWWHFSTAKPSTNPAIIPLSQQVLVNASESSQPVTDAAPDSSKPQPVSEPASRPNVAKPATLTSVNNAKPAASEPAFQPVVQVAQPALTESQPARTAPASSPDTSTVPASGQLSVTRTTEALSMADSLRMQIGAALEHNEQAQAIQLLRELVVLEDNNPQPAKKLASVYYAQGQVIKAQAILDKQIRLHPADPSVRLMSARLLVKQNEPDQALQRLYDLPASAAPGTDYISFRAALAQEQGRLAQAMSDYHQLVAQDSQNARWWLGLGIVADQQNQNSVAQAAYQHALSLKQLAPSVHQYISSRLASLQELHNG